MSMYGRLLLLSKMGENSEDDVCDVTKFWLCPDYQKYKAKYGDHFSHKMAKWAVECLEPKGKWSQSEVWAALKANGIEVGEHHKYDIYFHANHLYSDYGKELTDAQIIKMAGMAISDDDGYSEMIFGRYLTDKMYKHEKIDFSKMM